MTIPKGGKLAAVTGYTCVHGHAIPMSGVSAGGKPWSGMFCPAGTCRPSWRDPADPVLVLREHVDDFEEQERMASVKRSGVLPAAIREGSAT